MAVRQRRHGRKQLIVRNPPLQDPCSHPFGRRELESARKDTLYPVRAAFGQRSKSGE